MATVAKRPEALADIERIWLESAKTYGPQHAERLAERFDRVFNLLQEYPSVGRARPDLGKNLRFIPLRGYPFLIFFTVVDSEVEIIRILHAKMRREPELKK